jgi:hypothetical protein
MIVTVVSRLRFFAAFSIVLSVAASGVVLSREDISPAPVVVVTPSFSAHGDVVAVERRWQSLFTELQPEGLSNCQLERFGESHDGGYLMCSNLLNEVTAGYSYGISGYDKWGCDLSRRSRIPVHQYDCFNLTRPSFPGGRTIFHEECVAGRNRRDRQGRLFDTMVTSSTRMATPGIAWC